MVRDSFCHVVLFSAKHFNLVYQVLTSTKHSSLPEHQRFTPAKLTLSPPAGQTPPLTSCPCEPHPASLAPLRSSLLRKAGSPQSPPALLPWGSGQLLTFDSHLIYVVLYLCCHCDFPLISNANFSRQRPLLILCYISRNT